MRSVYLAFLFALLATCAATYETRATLVRRSDKPSLNPPSIHAKRLTNAQRLARGLSLAPPKFHSGRRIAGRADPSATPTPTSTETLTTGVSTTPPPPPSSAAPSTSSDTSIVTTSSDSDTTSTDTSTSTETATSTSSTATATCTTRTGVFRVTGGSIIGDYVSAALNSFGEYSVTADASQALEVQYTACGDTSYGPGNLLTLNGVSAHSYLGGIKGYADTSSTLGSGSRNYAYLGGTDASDVGTGPQSGATSFSDATNLSSDWESAIWLVDSGTYTVTAQWVNNDGSIVSPVFVYNADQDIIVLTGDAEAFSSVFGSSPVVILTFVEGSSTTVPVPAVTLTD